MLKYQINVKSCSSPEEENRSGAQKRRKSALSGGGINNIAAAAVSSIEAHQVIGCGVQAIIVEEPFLAKQALSNDLN